MGRTSTLGREPGKRIPLQFALEAKGACLSKLAGKKLRIHSEKGSPIKNQIGLCNSFLSNKIQGDVPTRSHCSCIPSSGLT